MESSSKRRLFSVRFGTRYLQHLIYARILPKFNLQMRYLHYWAINRLYPKLVVLNVKLTSVIQQLGLVVVRMKMGKLGWIAC